MARLNIEILRISELKWMGMGKFNSNGHFIYYSGQESHRRNRASLIANMEKAMAPHASTLPGKFHGWRSLVGCSPWGHEESDTTERLHFPFSLSCIGEGDGNRLQSSCLENPRDGGAWWAAVHGVAQSRTRLKGLSSSSSSSIVNKRNPKCSTWGQSQKRRNDLSQKREGGLSRLRFKIWSLSLSTLVGKCITESGGCLPFRTAAATNQRHLLFLLPTYLWALVSCLWISLSIFLYGGLKPVSITLNPH